jgi:hypothetical protein
LTIAPTLTADFSKLAGRKIAAAICFFAYVAQGTCSAAARK